MSAQRKWLEELGEAATLPASDPRRAEMEARVQARGGQALAHWQALIAEDAAWRGALRVGEAPEGLADRLRAIPEQNAPVTTASAVLARTPRWLWAGVAVVAVGVLVVLIAGALHPNPIQEVALLALNDHLDTHSQDVHADEPAELARRLQSHLPFPVEVPSLGEGIVPVGGRKCTLGSHIVAFTAWQGRGGRLSMVQLKPADFGLAANMAPRVVRPEGDAARAHPLDVLFFGNGEYVWVVVADDAQDLRRVRDSLGNI